MVNKELTDYIKSVKEKGYPDEAIKKTLLQYNYTQDDIDEAFKELLLPAQPISAPSPLVQPQKPVLAEKKKKSNFPVALLILFIILLLGGAVFAFWKFAPSFSFGSSLCQNTSIDIYHIKGEPVVCIFPDNSKVQLIIFNSGNTEISRADITVSGSKGKAYDIIENLNLKSQDVFTRTFNYDYSKTGDIQSITLIPYTSDNGNIVSCGSKKVTYDRIETC
jgi:hypothetical protein